MSSIITTTGQSGGYDALGVLLSALNRDITVQSIALGNAADTTVIKWDPTMGTVILSINGVKYAFVISGITQNVSIPNSLSAGSVSCGGNLTVGGSITCASFNPSTMSVDEIYVNGGVHANSVLCEDATIGSIDIANGSFTCNGNGTGNLIGAMNRWIYAYVIASKLSMYEDHLCDVEIGAPDLSTFIRMRIWSSYFNTPSFMAHKMGTDGYYRMVYADDIHPAGNTFQYWFMPWGMSSIFTEEGPGHFPNLLNQNHRHACDADYGRIRAVGKEDDAIWNTADERKADMYKKETEFTEDDKIEIDEDLKEREVQELQALLRQELRGQFLKKKYAALMPILTSDQRFDFRTAAANKTMRKKYGLFTL